MHMELPAGRLNSTIFCLEPRPQPLRTAIIGAQHKSPLEDDRNKTSVATMSQEVADELRPGNSGRGRHESQPSP